MGWDFSGHGVSSIDTLLQHGRRWVYPSWWNIAAANAQSVVQVLRYAIFCVTPHFIFSPQLGNVPGLGP